MTMPLPSDSEKKACPSAARKVLPVTSDQSGLNMYSTPAPPPGSVSERMAIPVMMTKSTGIMIFEKLSMPFLTPETTMPAVTTRKTVWQISGAHVEEEKVENMDDRVSSLAFVKSNLTAFTKYSMPQPPTTE